MPSIAQSKLDELNAKVVSTARLAEDHEDRAVTAERRLRAFDTVLDKIVRAANGMPLSDSPNRGEYAANYMSMNPMVGEPTRKLKTEERQEQEIRALNERIVGLEARLAAVTAVATFAKNHKA